MTNKNSRIGACLTTKTIIAVVAFNILTFSSYACDCLMYKQIESYVDKVDIIFTGKVISLLDSVTDDHYYILNGTEYYRHQRYTARILVIEKFKTGEVITDTLDFTSDYSDCDPLYKLGETYLFFANRGPGAWFKMGHCTPWGPANETKKRIRRLRRMARK
jgi:hypothetical protein